MSKEENIKKFMAAEILLSFLLFLVSYQAKCSAYNTTLYAFSYRYGFISRAFIGSLYALIDAILPVDMMSYAMAMRFTEVVTVLFYLWLFGFFLFLLKRCREENLKALQAIIVFFSIFAVSMFADDRNFGRVDLYLIAIAASCTMLIIKDRGLWLLPILTAVAMMIHQGYVFMFFNVTLVLLIYRFFSCEKKDRKKYGIVFALTFLVGSALFLYFEFFSRGNGAAIYDDIVARARILSFEGDYHETLIDHEILNVDLSGEEWSFHLENFIQQPVFLLLMAPFLVIGLRLLASIVKAAETGEEKIKYLFVAIGVLTIVPNYVLKVDYARWTMAVITYYCFTIGGLIAMGDRIICEKINETMHRVGAKYWSILLLAYTVMFIPFWDVYYDSLLKHIGDWINLYLHIY